jgi:hypothetical protein
MEIRLVEYHQIKDLECPVIKSTYSRDDIQNHLLEGKEVLIRAIERNSQLERAMLILVNHQSHKLIEVTGRRVYQQYGNVLDFPESEWKEIGRYSSYARERRDCEYGAYLIPYDLEVGTRVYLPELIEDVVATDFWGKIAAEDGFAVWDGKDLKLDLEPYERIHLIG